MRVQLHWLALASALFGCNPDQPQVGTNTNWMMLCDSNADCGTESACLCGRCTSLCSPSEEDEATCPDGTVCAPGQAARLQCQGDETFTCQTVCQNDSDCQVGRLCYHGVCTDSLNGDSCPAEALFCEDFEDGSLETLDLTEVITDGNSLAVVEIPSPSASAALQVHVSGGPSVAYARAPLEVTTSGELFLSGWVRVPDQEAHNVAPLSFWTAADEGWALRFVITDAGVSVWSGTQQMTDRVALIPGGWHCLQLQISVADAGSVAMSIDAQSVAGADEVDTLPDGGIEAVAMGTLWAASEADFELDRIIVSTDPIDCYR